MGKKKQSNKISRKYNNGSANSTCPITIDEEFKNLLPSLSKDEYEILEKSLVEEGCREAIYIWNGLIVDGFNRYEICVGDNREGVKSNKDGSL